MCCKSLDNRELHFTSFHMYSYEEKGKKITFKIIKHIYMNKFGRILHYEYLMSISFFKKKL